MHNSVQKPRKYVGETIRPIPLPNHGSTAIESPLAVLGCHHYPFVLIFWCQPNTAKVTFFNRLTLPLERLNFKKN